ncbi:hypothetical protein [Nocardioides sp.]|uniref:hypothetical protein n=1 Tax=Nocardioides sp. TaxID=35761 RepID=UPI003D11F58E
MHRSRTFTALATIAMTLGAGLATSAAADAAPGYVGQVDAAGGLAAHYVPAAAAPRYGGYGDGTRLTLVCKVRSVSIGGNDLWYLVHGSKRRWVSARYVDNVGPAPRFCGDGRNSTARVTAARLNRREAPTLRAATDGVLARGARVSVVCWVDGLGQAAGDTRWYQLASGSWVSADHIGATKRRVELCA